MYKPQNNHNKNKHYINNNCKCNNKFIIKCVKYFFNCRNTTFNIKQNNVKKDRNDCDKFRKNVN